MAGTKVCQVAEETVSSAGVPTVQRVFCALASGRVVNPDPVRAQVEGSIVFGRSVALRGRISGREGRVEQSNLHG